MIDRDQNLLMDFGVWKFETNGNQIERLQSNVKVFDGAFGIYNLPEEPRLHVCYLDQSHKSESHWISTCVDDTHSTLTH